MIFVCDDKEIDVIPFKYGETIPGKQIPGKQTSGINVYIFKNGTWQKTEYTTKGSYLLFNMDGTDVTFIITSSENNTVIIILIILAALLGIIIFLWMRRRLS